MLLIELLGNDSETREASMRGLASHFNMKLRCSLDAKSSGVLNNKKEGSCSISARIASAGQVKK